MNDIKLFAKNKNELETLIQAVRIYSQDIGMEYDIEKCTILIMKNGKQDMTKGMELPNPGKIRTFRKKKKPTNTREYRKWTSSNRLR